MKKNVKKQWRMPIRLCVSHTVLVMRRLNIRQVGLEVVTYGPGETCILIHILLGVVSITHHSTPFVKVIDTFNYAPTRKCFKFLIYIFSYSWLNTISIYRLIQHLQTNRPRPHVTNAIMESMPDIGWLAKDSFFPNLMLSKFYIKNEKWHG